MDRHLKEIGYRYYMTCSFLSGKKVTIILLVKLGPDIDVVPGAEIEKLYFC